MGCSTSVLPVHQQLLELAQTHVHWVGHRWWCHLTISSSVVTFSFCLSSFPTPGSFPMSQFFASGGQSTGASASASVLPMNIQSWFPLGLTGLIPWFTIQGTLKSLLQPQSSKASKVTRRGKHRRKRRGAGVREYSKPTAPTTTSPNIPSPPLSKVTQHSELSSPSPPTRTSPSPIPDLRSEQF